MSSELNNVIDLVNSIRGMTSRQVGAMKPADIFVGTVLTEEPLTIKMSDKLVLDDKCLYLGTLVVDHNVDMTVHHLTEKRESVQGSEPDYRSHDHEYEGRKRFFVCMGLKKGEKVLLLRLAGGQKYYVIDRVRSGNEDDTD